MPLSSPQTGGTMASFMHQHHSGSDAESEPEETDNRQAASNRGASHFAAFASSKTANWRDALMSDPEEDDDHELDARALIAEAHKAINADHVSNDPKQNTALCASTSTSQARLDDSLLIDGPLAKQRDSAPTSPESQQGAQAPLAHKQTSRRINHGSDDDLEQPPSVPPASSSKGDKLHQLAAARREREIQKQAAADKNKQPVTTEIDEDANLTVQIVDDDLEDDEEPSLKVGGGGIFKPGKNKGNLKKSGKVKSLPKADLLEMQAMSAQQRLQESARIEPAQKRTYDANDMLARWKSRMSSVDERSASNFKDAKKAGPSATPLAQAIPPSSGHVPPAPTPMEQHADKDHLEESFPRDEYLESQEESFSTPAVSHTRPPPTSHDTIQDSTSSPRDFYTMHQVHYRKPMLAFGKISKTKDNEGSPLEDLPDADALQTWSKNSKASKETKRKVLAQQASRPPQPGSDSDDSDGLEIVRDAPAKHLPVAGPSRAGSKPPRPPSAMHRKSSGSGRPQLDFTDSQFREAGQKWGSGGSSSHNRKGKQVQRNHVGKDGLNSTLLRRSHEQGRANADKRRAEWHARGGRERKDQKAQEGEEGENGQSDVKNLLHGLQEDAKMEESRAEDEDEDEDDGDFNPDAMDEVGGEEEDDEETAELRQSGFFNDTAEQNEEDEYEDADEQAEMESDTDAELPKDNTVSPARIQRRLIQNESSFISDTTTLSPSQAPPQLVTKPVLDFGNGAGDEGGFSQFFDADEFSTQPPVADADGKPDNAGGLFQQQPVANMGGIGQLTKFPNFFVSQRERERNYDQLEEQAGFVAAAQDGAGLDQGPKMQFLNSQGMLTQHAPVAQDSQPLQDSPTQVDADDSMLVESDADSEHEEEDSGQSNSQTPQKFRHLKDVATVSFTQATQQHSDPTAETANRPSFAIADDGEEVDDVEQSQTQEAIPNSPKALNAFDIMQQAQQIGPTASSSELAGEHKKEKKKKERNAFVQDQADESDEEAGFMRGFAKKKDDEEDDDNSDDEGSVKEIFDDAKVDDDLQREQDDRVIEKDQQLARQRDERAQKDAEKVARGAWRHKKRNHIGDLSDSDFSDEEFGNKRAARNAKSKKRKLQGKDQMDDIANNPETHAFAESYRETTTVEGRGEDYGFLQDADSADDDDDEDEDPGHRRIKERMDAVDRQAYIVREIKRRKKAQANEDWDEYEEDEPVFLNGVSSSSPPPQPQYKIKIKDRTEATRPAPKNIYKDTYEDIEMEYSYFSREEPAHIQKIRAQEAVEGSSKSDSFSRRAGQSSSVTSMAARKPAVSTLKTTSATSAVPREQAQSHRSKAPPSRGLGKSLSEARTAGFRR